MSSYRALRNLGRSQSLGDSDGSIVFNGRLPALAGELFLRALDAANGRRPHAIRRTMWSTRCVLLLSGAADALALIAECFLKHGVSAQSAADRYQVVIHVGGWRFLNQDGRAYKGAYQPDAPRYAADALRSVHDACNLNVTPRTATSRWAGERMNYDLALLVLFDCVSAATQAQTMTRLTRIVRHADVDEACRLHHLDPASALAFALLVFALIMVIMFEATNGFHDAANAVATVIYTKSLKPGQAIVLSGALNFVGVMVGGVAVAYALVELLPAELLSPPDGAPAVARCPHY